MTKIDLGQGIDIRLWFIEGGEPVIALDRKKSAARAKPCRKIKVMNDLEMWEMREEREWTR